jgi:excisionase family DNA binding protein
MGSIRVKLFLYYKLIRRKFMENMLSQKKTTDSAEAIQALENSINILARMIVKAVMAELLAQERSFGQAGGSLTAVLSSKANIADQGEKRLVFSVSEVAKVLGIGRSNVYNLVHTKQIPCIKYGKRMLIPRFALMKMLEEASVVKQM